MNVHVLLNFLNKLATGAQVLDSIYHMALKAI